MHVQLEFVKHGGTEITEETTAAFSVSSVLFFPAFHLDFRELNAVAIGDIKWCKEIKFLESERLEMDHVDLLTTDWAKKTVLDPLGN